MTAAPSPARVDFYVLETSDDRARLLYVCRLVEKAFQQNQTVYVHAGSIAEADQLDELLWTFADKSFVPHLPAAASGEAPVRIGCGDPIAAQVLVQLGTEAPEFAPTYERVAEFVDAEPGRRDQGRKRFAWYRDRGLKPETHKVGADGTRG